jgi:hypothetical protein
MDTAILAVGTMSVPYKPPEAATDHRTVHPSETANPAAAEQDKARIRVPEVKPTTCYDDS